MLCQILLTREQACALRMALMEAEYSYKRSATLWGVTPNDPWYNRCMKDAQDCRHLLDIAYNAEYVDSPEFGNIEVFPFLTEEEL